MVYDRLGRDRKAREIIRAAHVMHPAAKHPYLPTSFFLKELGRAHGAGARDVIGVGM